MSVIAYNIHLSGELFASTMTDRKKRPFDAVSDEALISDIAAGDRRAFAEFYDRLSPQLYGLALKILRDPVRANDVLQDVFLSLWKNAGTYTLRRGRAIGWMCAICRNRCIDMIRSSRKRQSIFEAPGESGIDSFADHRESSPAEKTIASNLRNTVFSAMSALPNAQRQVMELAYQKGLTQSEIAAQLELPIGTVKSRMRLGMDKLREALAGKIDREDLS